jgi:GDP-L-fucose synthase
MNKSDKIFVAGHRGLVGSAIVRKLHEHGYSNVITRTRGELDLRHQGDVASFFEQEKPNYVFLAAAKVGGIQANDSFPADFLYENLAIQNNIIYSSFETNVKKLLFLGSSCIYPKYAQQPIKEEYLLDGKLEPTNEAYAIAKIAGLKMCEALGKQHRANFIAAMPTNLYGPNDNFDLNSSHVLPALIRKFHEAKMNQSGEVIVWGTGAPRREFLFVDDLAEACLYMMLHVDFSNKTPFLNVGTGTDITIHELAYLIKDIVGFNGNITFDTSKPDGTPRKLLDVSRLASLGWEARTSLEEGIIKTYEWYLHTSTK